MPLTVAELKTELDATEAKLAEDVRQLEERLRSAEQDLKTLAATQQELTAEVHRWHEALRDNVGRPKLVAELKRLEGEFHGEVAALKQEANASLERIKKELGDPRPGKIEATQAIATQMQIRDALPAPPATTETARRPREIGIKEYVDSLIASSARVRGAVYVVAVTSLIVFSTYWNVHPGSWLQERVKVAREMEELVAQTRAEAKAAQKQVAQGTADAKAASAGATAFKAAPPGDTDAQIHRALLQGVITKRRLDWLDSAQTYRQKLEELLYVEAYQVRIPFFGVTYDINDLGMFGGFAFFVVLMILHFSLARELANLRLAFEEAEARGQFEDCFKLLGMGQVLAVPRYTGVTSDVFTRNLHRVIYILSIFILSVIMYHDITSIKSGLIFSVFNTVLTLMLSAGFFMINLILTYRCFHFSHQFDKTWTKYGHAWHERLAQRPVAGALAAAAVGVAPERNPAGFKLDRL